jgi:hypothetical protein
VFNNESSTIKKAPDDAGAFRLPSAGRTQYLATTGPLKR